MKESGFAISPHALKADITLKESKKLVRKAKRAKKRAARADRVKNLEYDLASNVYYYMFEPNLCVTNFYHPDGGWNHGRSNNQKVIELIEAGRKEVDYVKRQKIYWQIEEAFNENYEDVYIWWPMIVSAYSKQVRGYVFEGGHKEHKEVWDRTHPLWFKDGHP